MRAMPRTIQTKRFNSESLINKINSLIEDLEEQMESLDMEISNQSDECWQLKAIAKSLEEAEYQTQIYERERLKGKY